MGKIICISRQFGSGGHDIGLSLAKKLYVPFYDYSLSEVAASNIGVDISKLDEIDENASNSIVYSLVMNSAIVGSLGSNPPINMTAQDRLFAEQSRLIEEYAQQGPCVIVGRCSGYILKDNPDVINVYICSSFENRLDRIMQRYGLNEANATSLIKKKDKMRASYFHHYTNRKWGVPCNYDLCLNTDKIKMEDIVKLLLTI